MKVFDVFCFKLCNGISCIGFGFGYYHMCAKGSASKSWSLYTFQSGLYLLLFPDYINLSQQIIKLRNVYLNVILYK